MKICPRCQLTYVQGETHCVIDGATLEVSNDPLVGTIVGGRYRLERVLGKGGMATVYAAAHRLLPQRKVAVKILHERFAHDVSIRERLDREARSSASVAHPNVVEVYDTGITETGVPFLVCELLEGLPLDQHLARNQGNPKMAITLGLQIARGLGRAHDLGVVHRDIKPENIFVCRSDDGEPVIKIVDFGIAHAPNEARLTQRGAFVGSPPYMAPERFSGQGSTPAADLYALGVVLFEMAAGRLPFIASSLPEYIMLHLETPPEPLSVLVPDCPPALVAIVAELLAKQPESRPHDAHVVEQRLTAMASSSARRVRRASALSSGLNAAEIFGLDQWSRRVSIYDAMLHRMWPNGAPLELVDALSDLTGAVARLRALDRRASALGGEIEVADDALRERREQLGRAVATLGEDLSAARASLLGASHGRAGWTAALEKAQSMQNAVGDSPKDEVLAAMRDATGAYAQWLAAWESSPVPDLEFQLKALRQKLHEAERDASAKRGAVTDQVRVEATERTSLEHSLLRISHKLNKSLRPHAELSDLFAQLAQAGA